MPTTSSRTNDERPAGKRRRLAVGAGLAAVLVGAAAVAVLRSSEAGEPTTLGGAALLASGGDIRIYDLVHDNVDQPVALDNVEIDYLSLLQAGDDGTLYLLAPESAVGGLLKVDFADTPEVPEVVDAGLIANTAIADALGVSTQGSTARAMHDNTVSIRDFNWLPESQRWADFPVGALVAGTDGTILVASADGTRIDALALDRTTRLLGPPGSGARAEHNATWGPIVALLQLPDDRITFVAGTSGHYTLWLLDDSEARPVLRDSEATNPVTGPQQAVTRPGIRRDELPMAPIALAPGGRILTIGLVDGAPQIAVIDPDTGHLDVLARLNGVIPTLDQPISAAAVGNDLVFLAQDQIWRIEGAFTG